MIYQEYEFKRNNTKSSLATESIGWVNEQHPTPPLSIAAFVCQHKNRDQDTHDNLTHCNISSPQLVRNKRNVRTLLLQHGYVFSRQVASKPLQTRVTSNHLDEHVLTKWKMLRTGMVHGSDASCTLDAQPFQVFAKRKQVDGVVCRVHKILPSCVPGAKH